MAVSVKQGLLRVGVVITALWIVGVTGLSIHEEQDRIEECAIRPHLRICKPHYFWNWHNVQGEDYEAENDADDQEDDKADDKNSRAVRLKFGKVQLELDMPNPPVYKLDSKKLMEVMFGPLAAFWGLFFGISWIIDGFRGNGAKKPATRG